MAGPAVLRRWLEPVGNGGPQIDGRSKASASDRTRLTGLLIQKAPNGSFGAFIFRLTVGSTPACNGLKKINNVHRELRSGARLPIR